MMFQTLPHFHPRDTSYHRIERHRRRWFTTRLATRLAARTGLWSQNSEPRVPIGLEVSICPSIHDGLLKPVVELYRVSHVLNEKVR